VSVLPPFPDELGFGAEHTALKGLLSGQLSPVITFPVVLRRVVADGEARPLCVVVQIPHLAGFVMYTMLGLGLNPEIPVALVGVVVADAYLHVDAYIGRCPAVAVGGMLPVDPPDEGDDLLAPGVAAGRLAPLPLVVPCTAHAHQGADVLDGVVAGQQVHYFELFGLKRTYSRSPSAFV